MTHANLLLLVIDDGFADADGVVMTMIAFMVCWTGEDGTTVDGDNFIDADVGVDVYAADVA